MDPVCFDFNADSGFLTKKVKAGKAENKQAESLKFNCPNPKLPLSP
jgi:hypothetical protein